jgi:hypothetical protein
MSWAENRKHWSVQRQATGWYISWPAHDYDELFVGPIDWAEASLMARKFNAVVEYIGNPTHPKMLTLTPEKLLEVYDRLVNEGNIKPVEPTEEDSKGEENG